MVGGNEEQRPRQWHAGRRCLQCHGAAHLPPPARHHGHSYTNEAVHKLLGVHRIAFAANGVQLREQRRAGGQGGGGVAGQRETVEQGVALAVGGRVRLDDIVPPEIQQRVAPLSMAPTRSLHDAVDRAERETITAVLREVDGNRERAAEILGLSGTTLWRKMRRLNVQG